MPWLRNPRTNNPDLRVFSDTDLRQFLPEMRSENGLVLQVAFVCRIREVDQDGAVALQFLWDGAAAEADTMAAVKAAATMCLIMVHLLQIDPVSETSALPVQQS